MKLASVKVFSAILLVTSSSSGCLQVPVGVIGVEGAEVNLGVVGVVGARKAIALRGKARLYAGG
jgi:hypothetical protein